jgi:hypothetical protein
MQGQFYGYPSKLDKFYYSEDNRLYVDRGIGRCLYETMNNSIAKVKV